MWFYKLCQVNTRILWHATIPKFADEIINSGKILPSLDLGDGYAGWGFKQHNQQYGQGVYLATTAEDAIYYANIRLKDDRENREYFEETDLYDDHISYIALFKVIVSDISKLVPVNEKSRSSF